MGSEIGSTSRPLHVTYAMFGFSSTPLRGRFRWGRRHFPHGSQVRDKHAADDESQFSPRPACNDRVKSRFTAELRS